ncbi:MAG: T9SS type A sorting domain-containing protein [Chitinophagales bacterium]
MPIAAKNEPTNIEVISTSKLLLSPNPAQQSVHISCPTCQDNTPLVLMNVNGQVLTSLTFNQSYVLNLQHYPTGMYFIKAQNGNNIFIHKLLIIK